VEVKEIRRIETRERRRVDEEMIRSDCRTREQLRLSLVTRHFVPRVEIAEAANRGSSGEEGGTTLCVIACDMGAGGAWEVRGR
jgi:hypothetical protein